MRRQIASWFGRKEHWAGEALGILIVIHMLLEQDIFSIVLMVVWSIYFLSHKSEKAWYGHHGYR